MVLSVIERRTTPTIATADWEQTRSSEHTDVATALHNLAEIYQQEGELELARHKATTLDRYQLKLS